MTVFIYVLSYPPATSVGEVQQLQVFVEKNRDIKSWYWAFSGTYLFKSESSAALLSDDFRKFFGDKLFTISYVIPSLIGGSLPQPVWDWINSDATPSLSNS